MGFLRDSTNDNRFGVRSGADRGIAAYGVQVAAANFCQQFHGFYPRRGSYQGVESRDDDLRARATSYGLFIESVRVCLVHRVHKCVVQCCQTKANSKRLGKYTRKYHV
jgi:hypothetical protein